jgi:hypothetical protein
VRLVAYAFVGAGAGRRVDRGRLLWLGRGAKGEQFRRSHGAAAQAERGQTVISTGPYAVVRHPAASAEIGHGDFKVSHYLIAIITGRDNAR